MCQPRSSVCTTMIRGRAHQKRSSSCWQARLQDDAGQYPHQQQNEAVQLAAIWVGNHQCNCHHQVKMACMWTTRKVLWTKSLSNRLNCLTRLRAFGFIQYMTTELEHRRMPLAFASPYQANFRMHHTIIWRMGQVVSKHSNVHNNKVLGKATQFDYNVVRPKIINLMHYL